MDRFEVMRLFVRIVERQSFTLAALDTGVPRSTATQVIKQTEERLGARLLQRTTRVVRPTLDGEAYYRRCLGILNEVEDAEGAFRDVKPKGTLLVEVQGTLARHFLMPSLSEFFSRYPQIELSMSESDRWVDLVREGVDCVLRFGNLPDSDMVARRVGMLERLTCAAPAYFEKFGIPKDLESLGTHRTVGMRSLTTGQLRQLEFVVGDNVRRIAVRSTLSVTGPESFLAGGRLGLGLVQVPRFHVQEHLDNGSMLEVLSDWPPPAMPVSLLYPRNRQLSARVRVFLDWAAREFAARNVQADTRP